jgi:D-alanyl-D-alanine dipeptidase
MRSVLLVALALAGAACKLPAQAVPAQTAPDSSFRIVPLRPIEELRREAARQVPPPQPESLRAPDLVELVTLDSTIRLDIRYATTNNFMGARMYSSARAFLQRPAAEALLRAHRALQAHGYGLLIHDAYRPWSVTWMFWEATPPAQRIFVADPARGSRHNRGCAVDLTMYELATGRPVVMPSGYDEFTPRAHPDYRGGTEQQRALRALLRRTMEAEGFTVDPNEWWHYDCRDWASYPVLNIPLERFGR